MSQTQTSRLAEALGLDEALVAAAAREIVEEHRARVAAAEILLPHFAASRECFQSKQARLKAEILVDETERFLGSDHA